MRNLGKFSTLISEGQMDAIFSDKWMLFLVTNGFYF
jgi:hypothetical protein